MKTIKRLLIDFRALKISLSHKFVIGVAIVLTVVMGISLYLIDRNHEKLVMEQVDAQAKALFKQIVITRKWIADHGGVFVEKLPWKEASPYLKEPEIIDIEGKRYVKESPAMVTKELSEYAKEEGLYWFHITSLKLINPENKPDDFETAALKEFESRHTKEYFKVEKNGPSYYYRYIAPLYIEESCLQCHSHQGYKIGDVRGAISVSVPMDSALAMIRSERKGMALASVITISMLMIVLYVMMKELVLRPVNQLKTSIEDFSKGKSFYTTAISTGDELEHLSDSFVEMSKTLTEYHSNLKDKVKRATESLEKANARLTELNEKKSDFIAKISHELRTPMTSIKGAMDYLSAKVPQISRSSKDTEDLMEFLEVIKKNADRLIRMVNDTLDLERIESGMFDLHLSRVDLLSLIKEVITGFQSITAERNITFKIKANPKIVITADEDMMRQVLINLVSNAINFSPDNAEIHFTVSESDNALTVTLKDEGPGIPADVQEKIFDKFYTIGKRQGTGLGLAICKGIIEAHKGEIRVSGIKGNKGSAIYFTLPNDTKNKQ
jgi:signal transduction histidine kinase